MDEKKIRLLLEKFSQNEHKKYANNIIPKNPREISFEEIVLILKNILEEKFSIQHYMAVLKPDKKGGVDYSTFAGIVS